MDPWLAALIERLREQYSPYWLDLLDDAGLDRSAEPEPAPESVVAVYTWLLRRIGDGVRLTQAGYLPPAMVTEAMQALGWTQRWYGKQNREDMTIPILELRESAQQLGLLRKSRGHLLPTKVGRSAAEDPALLYAHIAARLPLGRTEPQRQAGAVFLLMTASGLPLDTNVLAAGMWQLGWADPATGRAPSAESATWAARDTWTLIERIAGPGPAAFRPSGPATPEAVRLARAALLGPAGAGDPVREPAAPRLTVVGGSDDRPRGGAARVPAARAGSARVDAGPVQLEVVLRDVEPRVWRRVVVPGSTTLRELHRVLQIAMGWTNSHLHTFEVDGVVYGDVEDIDGDQGDGRTFTVADAAASGAFGYEYDFGDCWWHDIRVLEALVGGGGDATVRVVDGARACPPEDCGGPDGYADLLEALGDPSHEGHAELTEWMGGPFDPEQLDLAAINAGLDRLMRRRR